MDAARYQTLKSIFAEALALTASSRAAFLDEVCHGDAELRREAEKLLAAQHTETFMAQPALDVATVVPDLGRGYRVLRELARGGMGVVYLAERDDGEYRSEVAVKVLTAAAALHPEAIARLRQERQILAQLNHPHIARLYDGGTTSSGLPYLVMEYVAGARIDDYAREHALTIAARIVLFLDVCAAVSFAHTNLIVHRDLKPSNILVTATGAPKLLDFGIAKPLQDSAAALTQEGGQMLTPRYASPEQLRGEAVTTASDVYSLGVVLYELLTGESPYGTALSTPHALAKAICDTEPPAPSTQRGAEASTRPLADSRALRGDLDAIVLKALQKRPAQRYASVDALSEDLRRHLGGLPVVARRGGVAYRARKFARRHWLSLSAAAALVALSIAFMIGLAWQLQQTRNERDKAEQVIGFMNDLFRVADPSESRGNALTVREALDRGAARLGSTDARLPDTVRGSLLDVVGRVYQHLGLLAKAEPLLLQARDLRAAGDADARTAAATALAELRFDQGKFKDSAEILQPLAADFRGDAAVASRLHLALGQAQLRLGERDAAQASFERALAEAGTRFGPESLPVADVLNALANVARDRGDTDTALRYFRHTVQIRERLSDDPWLLAKVRNNLGLLLTERGDYAAAEPVLQQSLDGMRQVLGEEHPLIATALGNFASVLQRRGHCDTAQPLLERAYALRQKLLGADNSLTAVAQGNLGYGLFCLGRYTEAEQDLSAALAVERRALGADNIYTLGILRNLAALYFVQGRIDEAQAGYRETLELGGASRASHPLLIQARAHLGRVLRYRGDAAAALVELDAAVASQRKLLPPLHPDLAEIEVLRTDAVLAAARPSEYADACQRARSARDVIATNLPETHADRAYATAIVAACADAGQGASLPREERQRALDALAHRYGAQHALVVAQREHLTP